MNWLNQLQYALHLVQFVVVSSCITAFLYGYNFKCFLRAEMEHYHRIILFAEVTYKLNFLHFKAYVLKYPSICLLLEHVDSQILEHHLYHRTCRTYSLNCGLCFYEVLYCLGGVKYNFWKIRYQGFTEPWTHLTTPVQCLSVHMKELNCGEMDLHSFKLIAPHKILQKFW
jgi:hypothetical protein